MKTLHVPDMHCERCVARIEQALAAAGITGQVELSQKTVSVEDAQVPQAKELLDDLGFEAQE